jgi:YgiT-type zinc finger domain-containing protein
MFRFTGPVPCRQCQGLTHAAMVRSDVWQEDRLIVVEDIPAQICEVCQDRYYDTATQEALRALIQDDLKSATPKRVMEVPVCSLMGKYEPSEPIDCPECNRLTQAATVRSDVWQGDRLTVVEDIPAQICEACQGQYYDTLAQEALRALIEHDLKSATPKRVMEVPVYSLEGLIPEPPPLPPEASDVDERDIPNDFRNSG